MEITFISDFRFMKYNHYINIPKQMIEWNLVQKKHKNLKLTSSLQKLPDPIVRENDCYL